MESRRAWRRARHGGRDLGLVPPARWQLVVEEGGDFVGSVSGGCIEGAVVTEARQTIQDGQTRLIDYGISDETAWQVGLACGGKCEVFIEPVE